jgi:16S rRNA (cytosine1402-N4)-methyltransferase
MSKGILEASAPDGQLVAVDIDPDAIALARATTCSLRPRCDRQTTLLIPKVRKSSQNSGGKGWMASCSTWASHRCNSTCRPMVFPSSRTTTGHALRSDPMVRASADLVNNLDEKALADLIWRYGEERYSRKIARAIVQARPLQTTQELAALVAIGHRQNQ